MTKIADIIDIPRQVHSGDFVLKLTEGVSHAEETLRSYVVTPQLALCFDEALGLIQSSVNAGSSKGAYLHGSFGSGKSHFMAVLTLLLQGNPTARSVAELAPVVSKHNSWTGGKKILVVPYHLIGAVSLESAVLGQYAAFVRTLHPDAPTPGFYRAEKIFDDAKRLRTTIGDAAFFEKLGQQTAGSDSGWGALDSAWDAGSFDTAVAAPPGSEDRSRLVGDLVDSFFGAHRDLAAGREEGFDSLDDGLVILSRHARDLGYDAVVLFLDELVLWLASHAADPAWVNKEGQKVAKLVEAARMDRALPIVSFIARQRDLRELVGEHMPGADKLGFADVLNWWEARFDQITLEDRNLPAIVERRLLRPKNDEAKDLLDEAFKQTARVREEVMNTLLTREGDRDMFRQVYPFTPALIQTLIAVSSLLQRERTALKLLVQLLVDQRETLELGDLVPVGDLYDVIESGDEPFTHAMKIRFEQAKRLYRSKLIPLLEEQHGVMQEDVASGRAPEDKARAFRNDARLMKTLILSSLADGVEALKSLTPARLAALNHGTVRSPIQGGENQVVLSKVRGWAARVGEIKVADDAQNPVISLHLVGVDTEGILENAKSYDNFGNRIQKIRALLFEMVGIPQEDSLLPPRHRMTWKGTQRDCEILFRNVRELPLDNFEPQDADWRIVVDYPFDLTGHSPKDDVAKVQEYSQHKPPAQTIVWIPAFLTPKSLDELGRLVLLDHVLTGNKLDEYGAHVSQLDREQARVILVNQRDQIRQRVKNFILTAYGISNLNREAIDSALEPETNFYTLDPSLNLQPPVGATFRDALENLFDQALRHQYPAHPDFDGEVKLAGLKRVLEVVRRAAESTDKRVEVDRSDRDDIRRIALPLKMGQMGEAHFVLGEEWVRDFDQKRAQDGVSDITVKRIREWIDRPHPRGLPSDVANLLILAYAYQTNRSFYLYGKLFEQPTLDKLQGELELRQQALPDEPVWKKAIDNASALLGLVAQPFRSATNVAKLVEQATVAAAGKHEMLDKYSTLLKDRLNRLGIPVEDSSRFRSAQAMHALAVGILGAKKEGAINAIAQADVPTQPEAMVATLNEVENLAGALERTRWEIFTSNLGLPDKFGKQAEAALDEIREALRHDEHVAPLVAALRNAEDEALKLLQKAARAVTPEPAGKGDETIVPPPDPPTVSDDNVSTARHRVRPHEMDRILAELKKDAKRTPPEAWIEVEWRITVGEAESNSIRN